MDRETIGRNVIDSQAQFSGTEAVRAGQEVDIAKLDGWLTEHVPGYSGPVALERFKGGQSNPTYKLRTPDHDYVVRRKPPGMLLKGAHAVDREFRVLQALHAAAFPAPRPLALCTDDAVIGTWFYVMEFAPGRIFWDSSLPDLSPEERPRYFDAMNSTIAALHRLDPQTIGLADYGRPGNYFERQIARWSRQYLEDEAAGRDPNMDRLVEWLPQNIPPEQQTRVVHGDFRADNIVFHASEPKVVAVLDWELSTLGHPLADFTYHLMMYRLPPQIIGGFKGKDIHSLAIPTETEYVSAYCRRTGRAGIPNLEFHLAFNMFRFAAILHGIKGRIVRGTASSANARSISANVGPLAEIAWALVENT